MCVGVVVSGVSYAAPNRDARDIYKVAAELDDAGDYEAALARIADGLAAAPRDLALLGLKGTVLLKVRDYAGALAAYQAYLEAGATGANRREAQKIVNNLRAAQSTSLVVTVANGPATIYVDSKAQGVLCIAAPSCSKAMLPGDYKVIAERSGFELWTSRVTIEHGKAATLAVALVDKPSLLTVRASPAGAHVTVDDVAYHSPASIAAGSHRIVAALTGYAAARAEVIAREGQPVELAIALTPLVPLRVEPPAAKLSLDDQPIMPSDGGLAVPAGSHVLTAGAPGFRDYRVVIPAERPADYALTVELARVEPAAAVVATPARVLTGRRTLALALGGVAAVAAAGAVALGIDARTLADDALAVCPRPPSTCAAAPRANELNEQGRTRALEANLVYGVAGAAAIIAAVLWVTGAPEARIIVTPRLDAVAGVDLAMRF
jgi:hypothetical protein